MDTPIQKCQLCPLCADSEEWPYPRNGHLNDMHFTKGVTWKPEKGHPKYELHIKWSKLLGLIK